jgi:hypothetical protein
MWNLQSENYVPVGHSKPDYFSFYMATGVGGHGTDIVTGGETAGGWIQWNAGSPSTVDATMVHQGESFDLSAIGSSLTVKMGWRPGTVNKDVAAPTLNEVFQIGLLAGGTGTLSGGGGDSFYLGGQMLGSNIATPSYDIATHLYADGSVVASLDAGSSFTVGTNNTTYKHWYRSTITFTNVGSGTFDVGVEMEKWGIAHNATSITEATQIDADFASWQANGVAHDLEDLSDLHIGLGLKVHDNTTFSNTGAVYDFTTVPEPSGALLVAIASGLAMLRRRR